MTLVNRARAWWAWCLAHPVALPLTIFAFSRLVDLLMIQQMLGLQGDRYTAPGGAPAHMDHAVSLPEGLANWDGAWYKQIVDHGYPHHLPTVDGTVVQNAWAFYPLFPGLVRLVMVTGLDFYAAAMILNLICGAIASCLVFRLVRRHADQFSAAIALLGLMFSPMAPIFSAAYTESLSLLLLVAALMALGSRRYGWFLVWTFLVALVRPIALPLALVVGVHGLLRWRSESLGRREVIKLGATAVAAAGSFAIWPAITAIRTGELKAYFLTQQSWAYESDHGWPSWLFQALSCHGWAIVGTVGVLAAAFAVAKQRGAKIWGSELRIWTWAYPLYIIGSARPTMSTARYLLLTITPWWPVPSIGERVQAVRARALLVVVVVVIGVVLQYFWLKYNFIIWPDKWGAP